MARLTGRLGTLTARDVMTSNVKTIREDASLPDAVEYLRMHHITGAPVVDAEHRLLGILSLADLVTIGEPRERPGTPPIPLAHGEGALTWDLFEKANVPEPADAGETAADRMSRNVLSVSLDTPLVEVARAMCDGHWHRVPVLDEQGALRGIVSTMDVLAAVVNAADEEG